MVKGERGKMVDVMEKAEIRLQKTTIVHNGLGTLAEGGVSSRDNRTRGPGGEGGKGLLEGSRPVGIGEMIVETGQEGEWTPNRGGAPVAPPEIAWRQGSGWSGWSERRPWASARRKRRLRLFLMFLMMFRFCLAQSGRFPRSFIQGGERLVNWSREQCWGSGYCKALARTRTDVLKSFWTEE